jgi:hypothetical protein
MAAFVGEAIDGEGVGDLVRGDFLVGEELLDFAVDFGLGFFEPLGDAVGGGLGDGDVTEDSFVEGAHWVLMGMGDAMVMFVPGGQ